MERKSFIDPSPLTQRNELRPGSCDVNMGVIDDSNKTTEKKLFATDGREVPQDKVAAMRAYARELRIKYPKWKQHRIDRKVGEKFHCTIKQAK